MSRINYNVNIIGTLNNNNGVLSGFSSGNYATPNKEITLGNNFEVLIKCTTGTSTSSNVMKPILYKGGHLAINIYQGKLDYNWGSGSGWAGVTYTSVSRTPQDNTTYYFKVTYNGSRISFNISTDGTNYQEAAYKSTSITVPSATYDIGSEAGSSSFNGSIDLNECYIKVNNELVWEGVTEFVRNGIDIQLRHDTSTKWGIVNPILLEGEVGIETDTNKIKIGDGTNSWSDLSYFGGGGTVDIDNKSITTNSNDELQAIGVINRNNTTTAIKSWTGTKAQYDAIVSKDSNTLYNITDSFGTEAGDLTLMDLSGLNLPSNTKYKDLTLGADGTTYTAPANGWFIVRKMAGINNAFLMLENSANKMAIVCCSPVNWLGLHIYIPVVKGSVITCYYTATGSVDYFRFIYAQGSESEAT